MSHTEVQQCLTLIRIFLNRAATFKGADHKFHTVHTAITTALKRIYRIVKQVPALLKVLFGLHVESRKILKSSIKDHIFSKPVANAMLAIINNTKDLYYYVSNTHNYPHLCLLNKPFINLIIIEMQIMISQNGKEVIESIRSIGEMMYRTFMRNLAQSCRLYYLHDRFRYLPKTKGRNGRVYQPCSLYRAKQVISNNIIQYIL